MFNDILMAFDGSETAKKAAEEAIKLANEVDAEIHFIEVVDITAFPGPIDWENVLDRIEMKSSEELEEQVDKAREKGVLAGKLVTRGLPYEEILERSEEMNADLIVMGKKGKTGVEGVLGSTTERVLEKSEKPVMTVSKD